MAPPSVYFHDTLDTRNQSYWYPIEGLMPSKPGASVTLIFVSSHRLWHYELSNDPVFPARSWTPSNPGWYYNGDRKARPMICVDTTEVCAHGKCLSMDANMTTNHAWWLMKLSLERSNTREVLKHRLGAGLLAQQKISGYFTRGLDPQQWRVEARNFFATSLARIQWDLWSIATGEDVGVTGYRDYTPDEAKGRICNLYKFQKRGYVNVHWAWFWTALSLCAVICLTHITYMVMAWR